MNTPNNSQSQVQDFQTQKDRIKELNYLLNKNREVIEKCNNILQDKQGNSLVSKSSVRIILNDCRKSKSKWINEREDLHFYITIQTKINALTEQVKTYYNEFYSIPKITQSDRDELAVKVNRINRQRWVLRTKIEGLSV